MEINKIYQGDSLESLKTFPDKSINCCVTSPPYYGLRDYGTGEWVGGDINCDHNSAKKKSRYDYDLSKAKTGTHSGAKEGTDQATWLDVCPTCGATKVDLQLGLEQTPELYVERLVNVFREVKRVLRDDGTLWLNLGDSYWGGKGQSGTQSPEEAGKRNKAGLSITSEHQQLGGNGYTRPTDGKHSTIKPKDLIGIPWMVAFALRSDGWYLRQDIIWHKPNPMPESVTDRCTKSHEYIFLLSKSRQYYYDHEAIKTALVDHSENLYPFSDGSKKETMTRQRGVSGDYIKAYKHRGNGDKKLTGHSGNYDIEGNLIGDGMANKKSVWTVTTKPFKEAHFATFPPDLIVDCIKAGCPENGIILDPFMGSGTTAMVARKLNRNYVGCELNPKYIKIAEKRLRDELGMFQ